MIEKNEDAYSIKTVKHKICEATVSLSRGDVLHYNKTWTECQINKLTYISSS